MAKNAKTSVSLLRISKGPSPRTYKNDNIGRIVVAPETINPRTYKNDNIGRIVVAPETINEADATVDRKTWKMPQGSL